MDDHVPLSHTGAVWLIKVDYTVSSLLVCLDHNNNMENLTLEFNISELEKRVEVNELIAEIYCNVVKLVDEKDILGVQVLPRKWPRKVHIVCAQRQAKECLLIHGLEIQGRHISVYEPGNGLLRVTLEDAPIDMSNKIFKA